MSESFGWLTIAIVVGALWGVLRYDCRSPGARIRALIPILDLAAPVLVIGALFHIALFARHLSSSKTTLQVTASALPATAAKNDDASTAAVEPAATRSEVGEPRQSQTASRLLASAQFESSSGLEGQDKRALFSTGLFASAYTIPIYECPQFTCRILAKVSRHESVNFLEEKVTEPNTWGGSKWMHVQITGLRCAPYSVPCTPLTGPPITGWMRY
jgi:hypothetical protein